MIKTEKNKVLLSILNNLKSEFNINSQELVSLLMSSDKSMMPVEAFAERKLSVLQSVVKYLKENLEYSNKQIADILNKDSRSIWDAYEKAKTRRSERFEIERTEMPVPLSIFKSNPSLLESLVLYLKGQGWPNRKIAAVLNRGETTISTIYTRVNKRNG